MKNRRRIILTTIALAVLWLGSGCVVAERPGRHAGTYYYYPDVETYYYPRDRNYYWFDRDRDEWRHDQRPPKDFYRERGWVRLESDDEPHTRHEQIKKAHPPGRYDGTDRGSGKQSGDRDRNQDRDRGQNRDRDN